MKKKVLVVIQLLRRGGSELAAINFAKHLNKEKFIVDFLLINPYQNQDLELEQEICKHYKVFCVPRNANSYIKKAKFINGFLSSHNYDIVHSHVMFFNGIVIASAAKKNIPVRVSHSHGTKWNHRENVPFRIYKYFMRILINRFSTVKLACSTEAGIYLYSKKEFGKNGVFVPNGIDTKRYEFNSSIRESKRKELKIPDDVILIGHIGTIYSIKNQQFIIDVFAKMLQNNNKIKLMLVGEKNDIKPVVEKIASYGIEDKVMLAGKRDDVPDLLMAFDLMIFPSLHEGLPLTLIEAQAAALPCIVSDSITSELKCNYNLVYLSLNDDCSLWCSKGFELIAQDRSNVDISLLEEKFDISKSIDLLESLYLNY